MALEAFVPPSVLRPSQFHGASPSRCASRAPKAGAVRAPRLSVTQALNSAKGNVEASPNQPDLPDAEAGNPEDIPFIVDLDHPDDDGLIIDLDNPDQLAPSLVTHEDGITVVDLPSTHQPPRKERRRTRQLIEEITSQPAPNSTFSADANDLPPILEDPTAEHIRTVVRAADVRKAEDIVALRVSHLTYITSFIVLITGNNALQLRAIANLVEEDLGKNHEIKPRRIDGVPNSGWMLLDYGDFMVNVFTPEQRQNYDIESLWKRAEVMDISDCLITEPDPTLQKASADSPADLDDWLGDQ